MSPRSSVGILGLQAGEDVKNAQFASLPTGHWIHAEQPQAFIEVVGNFLVTS